MKVKSPPWRDEKIKFPEAGGMCFVIKDCLVRKCIKDASRSYKSRRKIYFKLINTARVTSVFATFVWIRPMMIF